MKDPTLVPWVFIWVGLIVAVSGAIISMWAWGQREPTRVESFGKFVIAMGFILLIGVPLVNGFGFMAYAFKGVAEQMYAAAHPSPEQ